MALFDFLFGEGQALAYIIEGVEKGLGLEEIKSALDLGGIFTRANIVEQVYGYLQNAVLPAKQYVKQLQLNNLPNIARIPLSLTPQIRNFAYTVLVQGISASTGEIIERQITISTNQLLTKQQAIDLADELSQGETKSGGLESGAGEVTSISQNSAGLVMP